MAREEAMRIAECYGMEDQIEETYEKLCKKGINSRLAWEMALRHHGLL